MAGLIQLNDSIQSSASKAPRLTPFSTHLTKNYTFYQLDPARYLLGCCIFFILSTPNDLAGQANKNCNFFMGQVQQLSFHNATTAPWGSCFSNWPKLIFE
jgi:hypothetical protein